MKKLCRQVGLLLLLTVVMISTVFAAPTSPVINKVRFSQSAETVRIVFDVDQLPTYKVTLDEPTGNLTIAMDGALDKTIPAEIMLKDPVVKGIKLSSQVPGKASITVNLKTAVQYKVFPLKAPNRLVLDIIKVYNQKIVEEVAPGLKLTTIMRGQPDGAISAHILDVDLKAGYALRPILSNDAIVNLETVKSMADRNQAIAAVNASYFALDGELLGLTKIDNQIISTAGLARTALGIYPDGKLLIGQVNYDGAALLPDGSKIAFAGVNCERGPNSLVLYNRFYDATTGTNPYGIEAVIVNDVVTAINANNSVIPADGYVLSAHGSAAQKLANLKVGDRVEVRGTLGPAWDQTLHIVGAGPMLIKNNGVYLTTKVEEFGPDVAAGRAPRTALGITKDGHVLLAVVDGRQYNSVGFTLLELALFMQEAGAVQAMNFDGGGSSEMVVNGTILNKPSDRRERRVGSALAIIPQTAIKLAK